MNKNKVKLYVYAIFAKAKNLSQQYFQQKISFIY